MVGKTGILYAINSEFKVARITWQTNIRAAMELRTAFLLQIFGMAVNDCSFLVIWLMFFNVVGSVNGWGGIDAMAMLGFGALSFGLAFGFAGGSLWIPDYVEKGTFDGFLLSPRNLYVRIITSRFDLPAIGDALLGAVLLTIYLVHLGTWLPALTMLLLLPPAMMVLIGVSMTCGVAAFFFPDSNNIVQSFFKMFLTPSLYPSTLFPSGARLVFTFVVPSLAVAGLPVEAIRGGDFRLVGVIWLIGLVWLLISILAFNGAVRRYESGNYIGLR